MNDDEIDDLRDDDRRAGYYDGEGGEPTLEEEVFAELERNGWDAPQGDERREWERRFGVKIEVEGAAPFEEVRVRHEPREGGGLAGDPVVTLVGVPVTHTVYHRDIEGEHVRDGASCWCRPVVVPADDPRTGEEILAELERADG